VFKDSPFIPSFSFLGIGENRKCAHVGDRLARRFQSYIYAPPISKGIYVCTYKHIHTYIYVTFRPSSTTTPALLATMLSTPSSPFRVESGTEDQLLQDVAFQKLREEMLKQEQASEIFRYNFIYFKLVFFFPLIHLFLVIVSSIPYSIVNRLLMNGDRRFCHFHQQVCQQQEKEEFRLHRDITRALLSPLLKLHGHAIELSTRLVSGKCSTEPERAFRGEARGALTWLHCILTEERDFCRAEGCPACVVLHILSSEPTIRLIAVACMFSQSLPQRETDANINSEVRPETTTEKPTVPSHLPSFDFSFWQRTLERAVCLDPLWGADIWPEIEYRAAGLEDGIKQLLTHCAKLRNHSIAGIQDAALTKTTSSLRAAHVRPSSRSPYQVHVRSIPLKPSLFARAQMKMVWKEQELVSGFLMSSWLSLCCNERRPDMVELSKRPNRSVPAIRERSVTT
jgi:hypothetical protein